METMEKLEKKFEKPDEKIVEALKNGEEGYNDGGLFNYPKKINYDYSRKFGGAKWMPHQVFDAGPLYCHSIGKFEDSFWSYPLDEGPSVDNILPFSDHRIAPRWDIEIINTEYFKYKWDELSHRTNMVGRILRNGTLFDMVYGYDHDDVTIEALHRLKKIQASFVNVKDRGFEQTLIGKGIWYKDQDAIIDTYSYGDAGFQIYIKPEIDKFKLEKRYDNDEDRISFDQYSTGTWSNILNPHIGWFRN